MKSSFSWNCCIIHVRKTGLSGNHCGEIAHLINHTDFSLKIWSQKPCNFPGEALCGGALGRGNSPWCLSTRGPSFPHAFASCHSRWGAKTSSSMHSRNWTTTLRLGHPARRAWKKSFTNSSIDISAWSSRPETSKIWLHLSNDSLMCTKCGPLTSASSLTIRKRGLPQDAELV